jgi:hypothetical protein
MSNEYLTRLTQPGMDNLYELYDCVTDNPADNLKGNSAPMKYQTSEQC